MASTYNIEPPPTAKVLLKTSQGDLVLELFAKQAPLASRNFLQHCLDGYYDNTIFNRLVPGFILQGGDPTGLGTGGVSAIGDGQPFADEFHSRLRFNRRGLLGLANSGGPNDNGSQFFLTLDKTPELQGKNTMFGRIEGDTIYNLMKMGETELAEEGSDRPLYPAKVLGAEILVNPFEDMVKRINTAPRSSTQDRDKLAAKKKRKANKTLLSFEDDDDHNESTSPAAIKKAKVAPGFRIEKSTQTAGKPESRVPVEDRKSKSPSRSPSPAPQRKETVPKPRSPSPVIEESPHVEAAMSALERTNQQIAALKQSMRRNNGLSSDHDAKPAKQQSALEAMMPANATRGRKRGNRATGEPDGLKAFNAFRQKLDAMSQRDKSAMKQKADEDHGPAGLENAVDGKEQQASTDGGEEKLCDLHFIVNCQSCTAWGDETVEVKDIDDEDTSWLGHSLSFAKDMLGKDLEWKRKMEGLEEFDPRAQNHEPSERKLKAT